MADPEKTITAQQGTAKPPRRLLVVHLQERFTLKDGDKSVRSRGVNVEPGVRVSIDGQSISGDTDQVGMARLDISSLPDARYTFTVSAAPIKKKSVAAGPKLIPTADVHYMDLKFSATIKNQRVEATPAPSVATGVVHGHVAFDTPLKLLVDYKPSWLKADKHKPRPSGAGKSFVILHRTDTPRLDIETLRTGGPDGISIHYVVDVDGHIVKMVKDDEVANHAGPSFFARTEGMNPNGIGIEQVNKIFKSYPTALFDATSALVGELLSEFSITRHHVWGHSDVETISTTDLSIDTLNPKPFCPGTEFDWPALANAGRCTEGDPAKVSPTLMANLYSKYFSTDFTPKGGKTIRGKDMKLQMGDNDKKAIYGGLLRPDLVGTNIIAELQRDVSDVGYSIAKDGVTRSGVFDTALHHAIIRFHHRFFSGSRASASKKNNGVVDRDTATMLQAALQHIVQTL
jgi:N-acetyl-anhydromuramyl-L-alanine amidase AmpD